MKYSVIVPTMWFKTDCLLPMLEKYNQCEAIGEVVIINNRKRFDLRKVTKFTKVKVYNDGENMFVNPSWNYGVKKAIYDKVIIANDDIIIEDLGKLLKLVDKGLYQGMIIGPGKDCFKQKRKGLLGPMEIRYTDQDRTYGFGTFMILYKASYIPIPEEMKVWWGDSFLYKQLVPFLFHGVDIKTDMRGTSRRLPLGKERVMDNQYYKTLKL